MKNTNHRFWIVEGILVSVAMFVWFFGSNPKTRSFLTDLFVTGFVPGAIVALVFSGALLVIWGVCASFKKSKTRLTP